MFWAFFIVLGLAYMLLHFEGKATREFYAEIYHDKMLITNEYTRRVISDVYVAVTHNIYYLEHTLDKPEGHKDVMERIVRNGTRVRSCGISFIEDYYYPQKGHHFCPFSWRNVVHPEVVWKEDMGDADQNYLDAEWFRNIVETDSAQWSDPFYDSYDEQTTLAAYMVPIHDPEGRVVAVLGADVSLDWLTGKLDETDSVINNQSMVMAGLFDVKSKSYIINHDGLFITHADEKRILKDNFYDHLKSCEGSDVEGLVARMKSIEEPKAGSLDRYLVDGEECYLFYIPLKYTRWVLVTLVPCSSIDMLSYVNGAGVLLLFILAIVLLVIVGHYSLKNGLEPIKQLIQSTDDIAKGKFDTPMPELKYNDEMGQLRDSIEKMQFMLSNYADNAKQAEEAPKAPSR